MPRIIRAITEVARCGAQYRTEALAPMGLKACHASYLTEICDHPGISQDQLAARICVNKSNVARQAAILEEEGFITRQPSPHDKRILQLYPTEKTGELLPQIAPVLYKWEACLTEGMSEEELELLVRLLDRMKDRASEWMENH